MIHIIVISRWHRLGISVKGNSVTAIIDCKKQQNREIKREAKDTIIHDGIILLAQQIDDNTFFEVGFCVLGKGGRIAFHFPMVVGCHVYTVVSMRNG